MISPNTIQQILSRIDIIEIIGGFIKLKKRGANYLGHCPFHNEKTPSFTVSPSKEIYKCFGCGKSGNTISFIMEHEKLSYVEALKWLAAKYGIQVEETGVSNEQRQQYQVSESLQIINNFAQKFYEEQLFDTEDGRNIGLSYLKERGFTEATMRKWGIGYAPDKRDAFASKAIGRQYNSELLLKTGLVVNRNEQLQDNYRDRIIFPIQNNTGKIIGFGARLIKKNDKAPKYINTPENELYVKSRVLYGIYHARQAIDRSDECLLVEGYTDVVSLSQAGIENVVASGGTSLTQDQLRLIKKYSNNLTIVYDGDSAGVKAALRGLDMALEEGLNVKLVLVPDNEDPDSYVQRVGATAFKEFIGKNKKDFVLFQLDVLLKDAGNDANKKSAVVNQVAETIAKIDKTEDFTKQQEYIRQCAQLLKIDEAGFTNLVNKNIRNRLALEEKKLPFEEAHWHHENAQKAADANYDDSTFGLLFKDDLQERELVRVLLEHGAKPWTPEQLVVEYVLSEIPDEEVMENQTVIQMLHEFRHLVQAHLPVDKSHFIYHQDHTLSTLAVSLLEFPYEESVHWKREMSASAGYQKSLFQQDYKGFINALKPGNEEQLMNYLNIGRDNTIEQVESAVNYLKLRKVKKLLLQNHADLEKATDPAAQDTLTRTHLLLKQMEIDLTKKLGSVIIK